MEPYDKLTKREKEVLGLVLQCYSGVEIARRLHIDECTVHAHITHIHKKSVKNPGRNRTMDILSVYKDGVKDLPDHVFPRLTKREYEVLGMVYEGYTNLEIQNTLGIKRGTMNSHISNIYSKLGVPYDGFNKRLFAALMYSMVDHK